MSFKKMRLMEEDEFLRMKDQQLREYDPQIRTLTLLKNEIDDLLTNDKMTVDEKSKLINRAQIRFDNIRNIPSPIVTAQPAPIVERVPPPIPVVDGHVTPAVNNVAAVPIPNAQVLDNANVAPMEERSSPPIDDVMGASLLDGLNDKQRERGTALIRQLNDHKDFTIKDGHPKLNKLLLTASKFEDIFKYLIKPSTATPRGAVAFANWLKTTNIDSDTYSHYLNYSPHTPNTPSTPSITKSKSSNSKTMPPGTPPSVLHVYK